MSQIELKKEIENTREILNTAIQSKRDAGEILYISRELDGLIEKYLTSKEEKCQIN